MTPEKGRLAEEPPSVLPMGPLEVRCEHAPPRRVKRTTQSDQMEAGRAR